VTFAVPFGHVAVAQFSTLAGVSVRRTGSIGKALALGPDSGVNHTDDDVFTGAVEAAKLIPQAARCVEAKEGWRGGRVHRLQLVLRHVEHARLGAKCFGLRICQFSRETVEGVPVVVDLSPTHPADRLVVPRIEICGVRRDVAAVRIDLLPAARPGCWQTSDTARIPYDREISHLNDVKLVACNVLRTLGGRLLRRLR
jgi:hypothetical protein